MSVIVNTVSIFHLHQH